MKKEGTFSTNKNCYSTKSSQLWMNWLERKWKELTRLEGSARGGGSHSPVIQALEGSPAHPTPTSL